MITSKSIQNNRAYKVVVGNKNFISIFKGIFRAYVFNSMFERMTENRCVFFLKSLKIC